MPAEANRLAAAFEVPLELLPFVPELLVDLWDLGGWFDVIVDLLRPLGLAPEATTVLDLGSGKGAVSIHIAMALGFRTVGVDFFAPFVADARSRAHVHDVDHLCTFELGDIRETVRERRGFDVAIYASLGGVLGGLDECVGCIRRTVRAGGYIVLSDGYLVEGGGNDKGGYGHYVPHEAAIRQLNAHGDEMIREVLVSAADVCAVNRRYIEAVARRADGIAARQPGLAPALTAYVERQRAESAMLENSFAAAVWLLRRA